MQINVITVGQFVRPISGKHAREDGQVKRLYFMATTQHAGYYARVRFRHAIGVQVHRVEMLRVSHVQN